MFFKLVARNSKRDRKENGLFFASLIISVAAFYIILSLSKQDVMLFLAKMESDAVNRLLKMIPVFYGMTLFILFFLIYYASKFQLERRRHEFGVYLMMGMRRRKLFFMILAEDIRSSIAALAIGLPIAVLLSEGISLVTARLVGLGVIGHQITFSPQAVLWTALGFGLIKFLAFLILSGKIAGQEIASLLVDTPQGTKKQLPVFVYVTALTAGICCLIAAYTMAIRGISWYAMGKMALTLALGFFGTLVFFFGLRVLIGALVKMGNKNRQLRVFNFRQIQENVMYRSASVAISSLLILAALCCFGSGVSIAGFYGQSEQHVLDYTFLTESVDSTQIRQVLKESGIDGQFSDLFDMRTGYINTADDYDNAFRAEKLMAALKDLEQSDARNQCINIVSIADYPHVISLSSYNRLLAIAGEEEITLQPGEAAVYMDNEFCDSQGREIMDKVLKSKPEVSVDGDTWRLTGKVQNLNLITDRSLTLSLALILPDEKFDYYTQKKYGLYVNGVLREDLVKETSLLTAVSQTNEKLGKTGLYYESYLQNIGRQMFYIVAASYITIYLAIIFLIIANTVIGVQFLMGQQKSNRRYQTLIRLGATYETLCQSAGKQINWYFGIPVVVAALNSLFAVRALFSGLLSSRVQGSIGEMLLVSAAMILLLCAIEYIYMRVVKRASGKYLLTLIEPRREE